jgi:hypothetical protein
MPARFFLVNISGYVDLSTLECEKVFGAGIIYVIRGGPGGSPVAGV